MIYRTGYSLRALFFDNTGPLEKLFFNGTSYSRWPDDYSNLRNKIFFLETGFAIAEYVADYKFNITFVTETAQKSEVILIENRTDIIGISDNGRYIVSTVEHKNTLYIHDKTKLGIFEEDRIYYFEGDIQNQPGAVFFSDKDFLIFEGGRATSLNYDNFDYELISQEEGEVAVLNPSFVGSSSYHNPETDFFGKTPDEKYLFLYPYTEGGDNRNIVHLFNTEWSGSWDTTKSCYDEYVSYINGCNVVFTGSDNKYTAFMINSAGFEVYSISIDESFVASMSTEDQDFLVVCCGIIIVIFIIFVAIIKSDYFDLSKSEMVKNIILASALIPILWVLDMLDLFSMLGLFALALLFISYLRRDNTDSPLSHSPEMYGQQQQQQQQQQQLRFTPKAELVNIECPGCSSQMKVPKLNELQNVECKECGLAGEIKV